MDTQFFVYIIDKIQTKQSNFHNNAMFMPIAANSLARQIIFAYFCFNRTFEYQIQLYALYIINSMRVIIAGNRSNLTYLQKNIRHNEQSPKFLRKQISSIDEKGKHFLIKFDHEYVQDPHGINSSLQSLKNLQEPLHHQIFLNVANLKQKNVQLYFKICRPTFAMSNSSQSNSWTQLTKIQQGHSTTKGFEQLSLLFRAINTYFQIYSNSKKDKNTQQSLSQTNQQLERAESVSTTLDLLISDCILSQEQKLDCLQQSLRMMKKMSGMSDKTARTSRKKYNQDEKIKIIKQIELNIIQKIAEFILKSVIPNELTSKKIIQVTSIIIEELLEFDLRKQEQEKAKRKAKKREVLKSANPLEYCLMSGKKVNLAWLLIFRILQQKVMNPNVKVNINASQKQKNKESKQMLTITDLMEMKVNKMIKEIITFLMNVNESQSLMKNLLACLVENIKEMQLPIIPIILKNFHELLINQFKQNYEMLHNSSFSQHFLNKAIYSLENLNIICSLIKGVVHEMIDFSMEKEVCTDFGICSYCGITKNIENQRLVYQKIGIRITNNQNLVIRICISCCKILGFQPSNSIKIIALAPLIFSRFWNVWNVKIDIDEIRQSLRKLLIYHVDIPHKKTSNPQICIAEQIAMNNSQQKTANNLVEGIYKAFLFNHSKVSIKKILFQAINILIIYLNASDEKIRQKTIKTLHQSNLIDFIFNEDNKISSINAEEVKNLKDKVLAIIELKCRDCKLNVRLAALELLSYIYSKVEIETSQKEEFYQTIYKEIAFSNNAEYITKSIEIIEKSIISRGNKHKSGYSRCQYVKTLLKTFVFSLQCIRNASNSQQNSTLQQKVCKLINKLFKTISQICCDNYEKEQASELLNEFKSLLQLQNQESLTNLKDVYDRIITKMLKELVIDSTIIKNIPYFSVEVAQYLIQHCEQYEEATYEIVKANFINLIHVIFENVIEIRDILKKCKKENKSMPCMFKVNQLQDYFTSTLFLQCLIHSNEGKQNQETILNAETFKRMSPLRLIILKEILQLANICNIIDKSSDYTKFFRSYMKNKCKHTIQLSISSPLQKKLEMLANILLEQIKMCSIEQITLKGALIVNILVSLNRAHQVSAYIATYEKFTEIYIKNIVTNIQNNRQTKNEELYRVIINGYAVVTRFLVILTVLTTSVQKYLHFSYSISNIIERANILNIGNKRQSQKQLLDELVSKAESKVSMSFGNCYNYIIQILQLEFIEGRDDCSLQSLIKQLMFLLNNYWQIHPEIILTSSNLLKQIIKKTNEGHLIRNLFKLFLSLLPCSDIRILSIINHNFNAPFHEIFQSKLVKKDDELLEYSLRILQHILQSGMCGLYEFNRYVFCGLLHTSKSIRNIAEDIIKEIYSDEASEKLLFTNFSENMKFLFDFYFNSDGTYDFQRISLSEQQKSSLRTITNLAKINSKCLLAKEKRVLRIKTTFIKKISEAILNSSKLLQDNPLYLIFLVKLIKSQECFDYCELYEITFAINKIVTENYNLIEELRQTIDNLSIDSSENVMKTLRICAAYRQLVICFTYLTCYQQVQQQLKNYNRLFENSSIPYITLKEENQFSNLSLNHPINTLISMIYEDIDLNFDIAIGAIEFVQQRKPNKKEDSQYDGEQESYGSQQTKVKGRRGGKKRGTGAHRKGTKNIKNQSKSAQKIKKADNLSQNSLKQSVKHPYNDRTIQCEQSIY